MGDSMEFEENVYYDQSETPDIFEVNIAENVSAERCNLKGSYEFHISTENFAIVDKRSNKRMFTWPFRYVRRYGRSSTNFQFEAGRRCQSGEGLFSLLTDEATGDAIFNLVQTRFTSMQNRDRQFRNGSVSSQTSVGESGPTLPARQYENNPLGGVAQTSPNRKSQNKPPVKTKPSSIRKPTTIPPKPTRKESGDAPVNASQINMLIHQNKDNIVQADDDDNTYSVMGRDETPQANGAQYSAVYAQKAAQSYVVGDDTYDEVHLN